MKKRRKKFRLKIWNKLLLKGKTTKFKYMILWKKSTSALWKSQVLLTSIISYPLTRRNKSYQYWRNSKIAFLRIISKEVELKVKEEIEKLLKAKFIRHTRYVQWLENIVPMMKKNGKLLVCVDFRDVNVATPKDMYVMPITDMLVDSTANNELLSFMDGFSSYNQILIVVEDIPKIAFRCHGRSCLLV